MNEIFLDTETTGLSVKDNHRIVEIACIETRDLIPTKNFFHKLINPNRDVPEEAFKIHGFSQEFLAKKDTFDKIAEEFLKFIKGKKLIIHNASFDLSFLNYELRILKKDEIKKSQTIDSLELARAKFPGTSNSLDALCRRFNIDLSKRTKHNAILDCELLREVYINLLDVKEPKLSFTNNFDNAQAKKKGDLIRQSYSKKVVVINDVEINNHQKFLKNELRKNYY